MEQESERRLPEKKKEVLQETEVEIVFECVKPKNATKCPETHTIVVNEHGERKVVKTLNVLKIKGTAGNYTQYYLSPEKK